MQQTVPMGILGQIWCENYLWPDISTLSKTVAKLVGFNKWKCFRSIEIKLILFSRDKREIVEYYTNLNHKKKIRKRYPLIIYNISEYIFPIFYI